MKQPAKLFLYLIIFIACVLQTSCSNTEENRYRIGFSECVGGTWRDKVNQEMISAQHLYNNVVNVKITNAENNTDLQQKQIDSLVASGIDLLVVAPNEFKTIAPAIIRAGSRVFPSFCSTAKPTPMTIPLT